MAFTERSLYESIVLELNSFKAPKMYINDYNHYVNRAIQDYVNMRYAQYAISQQLEDDLQNSLRVVSINNDYPYPMNILDKRGNRIFAGEEVSPSGTGSSLHKYEYQPDQLVPTLYKDINYFYYLGESLVNMIFTLIPNTIGYDALYLTNTYVGDNVGNTPPNDVWMDNTKLNEIIGKKDLIIGIRGNSVKINSNLNVNNGLRYENIPFTFNLSKNVKSKILGPNDILFLRYNYNTGMFDEISEEGYISISDNELDILSPPDYQHLVELSIKYRYKNNKSCEKWKYKTKSAARLTADRDAEVKNNAFLSPKSYRPYYKVENDNISNKAILSLELGSDLEEGLIELDNIHLKYLKTPKKIILNKEDIELDGDRTDLMEFQDYVCLDIISRCVTLILEKDTEQRIQTQPVVSDSNRLSREMGQ